jgi:folate-dependent phosphoribosylglycinamide formyltransferase PurN
LVEGVHHLAHYFAGQVVFRHPSLAPFYSGFPKGDAGIEENEEI